MAIAEPTLTPETVDPLAALAVAAPDVAPVSVAAPAMSYAPNPAPQAHAGNYLIFFLSPLAFTLACAGIGLIVWSLTRKPPPDAVDFDKLDFRLDALTQSFIGGMLLIAGLIGFVGSGMIYLAGAVRSRSK